MSPGALLQSLLRNPLASPDLLGISGGSSVAAVFALLVLGITGPALAASPSPAGSSHPFCCSRRRAGGRPASGSSSPASACRSYGVDHRLPDDHGPVAADPKRPGLADRQPLEHALVAGHVLAAGVAPRAARGARGSPAGFPWRRSVPDAASGLGVRPGVVRLLVRHRRRAAHRRHVRVRRTDLVHRAVRARDRAPARRARRLALAASALVGRGAAAPSRTSSRSSRFPESRCPWASSPAPSARSSCCGCSATSKGRAL